MATRCQDSANGMRTAREKESVPSLHSFPCRVLSNRFWWTRQKEWEMSERTSLFVSFPFTSSRSILTSLVSHSPPVSIFSLSGDGMAMSSVLTDFYLRTWIREVIEWTVRPRAGTKGTAPSVHIPLFSPFVRILPSPDCRCHQLTTAGREGIRHGRR